MFTDKLKKALGEEAEKYTVHISEIEDELTAKSSRITTLETELREANAESGNRRKSIRDEWKPKVEVLEDRIQTLESENEQLQNSDNKDQIETLTNQNKQLLNQTKTIFLNDLKAVINTPQFSKVIQKFKLPVGDDGKILEDKLGEMPDEDVLHNSNKLSELKEIGFFEASTPNMFFPQGDRPNDETARQEYRDEKDPRKRDQLASRRVSKQ